MLETWEIYRMMNDVEDVEDDTLEGDQGLLDSDKSSTTGAPANYITKSVNVELTAGRFVRFISPSGEETIVLAGRANRFRKQHKVDGQWTVL